MGAVGAGLPGSEQFTHAPGTLCSTARPLTAAGACLVHKAHTSHAAAVHGAPLRLVAAPSHLRVPLSLSQSTSRCSTTISSSCDSHLHSGMGDAASLKLCVLGACRSGKTLLCRALAEQPLAAGEYQPTAAVRVQEVGNSVNNEQVKVQLWDVSGSNKYQQYWETLAQDADGVVLVIDPSKPEQEKELEQFYVNFAQPNSLTTKQCMVMAVNAVQDDRGNVGGSWQGLRGKLSKLQSGEVTISYGGATVTGVQEAREYLERLLKGCMARKRDKMERAVMGD